MTVLDEVYNFGVPKSIIDSASSTGALDDVVDQGSDMKDAFGTTIYDAAIGSQAVAPVVVCTIGTAVTASAIVTMTIKSRASATIASGTTHATAAFSAGASANDQVVLPVPVQGMNRYWGVCYTISGTSAAAGTVYAYMADAGEKNEANPQ